MPPRRETLSFAAVLATLVAGFFGDSLFRGRVLSPADVLLATASFRDERGPRYEPANRLLIDPVLQFQPWLEFNRSMLRRGRMPLWNDRAGCGAPHLANGQSAVFDPFHVIAYFGRLPEAYAWMAAARLWVAGLGAFLLAWAWSFERWGRWFVGLAFPFCGFLVVWLLFPVTNVAIWMPWLLLASERAIHRPGTRSVSLLGLVVGCVLLGGHVQTSAHVLLAAGLYAAWRLWTLYVREHDAGQARPDGLILSPQRRGEPRPLSPPFHGGPLPQRERAVFAHTPSIHQDSDTSPLVGEVDRRRRAGEGFREPAPSRIEPNGQRHVAPRRVDRAPEPDPASRLAGAATRSRAALAARTWCAGIMLGLLIGAVEIVPLGFYLAKSSVWSARSHDRPPFWKLSKPRLLDPLCTALPYAFGSQRRGQPNLARALGVHNLNESAGGFTGLATLLWLAPLGWSARRRVSQVRFLVALLAFGALGAFGFPPVDNVLRAIPVLNVTDNRRLSLWIAFALIFLGGAGIDAIANSPHARRIPRGPLVWLVAALALWTAAIAIGTFEPKLRARSAAHYAAAAAATPGADPAVYQERAERQVKQTLTFLPRYFFLAGGQLVVLSAIVLAWRKGALSIPAVRLSAIAITLVDLLAFGVGLNPAIAAADHQPASPVIDYLREEVGDGGRVLGVGEELPPNTLMRYGLNDVRNYDSVELARSLDWFAPLYDHASANNRSSRGDVTWVSVARARDRLRESSVAAVVGASAPPAGLADRVDRVGQVWVARFAAEGIVTGDESSTILAMNRDPGRMEITLNCRNDGRIIVRETFDPGWRAWVDGMPTDVAPERGTFLAMRVPRGSHRLVLCYDPLEVRIATLASVAGVFAAFFGLTGFRTFLSTRRDGSGLGWTQAFGLESNV